MTHETTLCPTCRKPITMEQRATNWSDGRVTHMKCGHPSNPKRETDG